MDLFDQKVDAIRECIRKFRKHNFSLIGISDEGISIWKCANCPYETKSRNRPE